MSDAGRFLALRADKLNFVGIESTLCLDESADFTHSAGFDMLGDDFDTFDEDFSEEMPADESGDDAGYMETDDAPGEFMEGGD